MSVLAVAHATAPFLTLYADSGAALCLDSGAEKNAVSLSNTGQSCAYSPDGKFFAVCATGAPSLVVVSMLTGEAVTLSGGLPPSGVTGVAFSHDGSRLAVAGGSSPGLTVYNTADWSKIAHGATFAGTPRKCAFNNDGSLLAVVYNSYSPYLTVLNTATWSPVAISGGNPASSANGCAFSADGSLLAVAHQTAPYLTVYNTSDWSKVSLVDTINQTAWACNFNQDGSLLAVTYAATPYVAVFSTATWTKVSISGGALPAVGYDCAFSASGDRLVCVGSGAPTFITTYDTATWSKTTISATKPSGISYGCAFSPASLPAASVGTTNSSPVTDAESSPVVCKVRAYSRRAGAFLAEATTAADGSFSISPFAFKQELQLIYMDPDGDPLQNDLIHRVFPA